MNTQPPHPADFIIIGAGIAGASVACWLAPHGRVVLLERESQPGYHSTGRSAAVYAPGYGNAQVRALTRASRAFFDTPPAGFAEHPLLTPRGVLFVAASGQQAALDALWVELHPASPALARLSADEACQKVAALRHAQVAGALFDPDASDIDVHALHQGFLKGMRKAGGQLVCNAEVRSIRRANAHWCVEAGEQRWEAPVVINAAGAWADVLARMAGAPELGLVPKRRTAFMFSPPAEMAIDHWPLVIGAAEDWYIKPDAGALLGSPANADPVPPQDVQPEELDIALAAHRIEEMTTLTVGRPRTPWAGLRSFVADGGLVGGFEPTAPGFFWLAAQGGYGIQTAPAMGQACAALARGLPLPEALRTEGLSAVDLGPDRLR